MLGTRFRVQNKLGVLVVGDTETGTERPATSLEVELWGVLISSMRIDKDTFVQVSEKDLTRLLTENQHMKTQIQSLQTKGTEQELRYRSLKEEHGELQRHYDDVTRASNRS